MTDQDGMVDYAWSHAVISDQLYHSLNRECDFKMGNQTNSCSLAVKLFLQAYSDIDMYSIYTPVCVSDFERRRASKKLVVAPRSFSQHVSIFFYVLSAFLTSTGTYICGQHVTLRDRAFMCLGPIISYIIEELLIELWKIFFTDNITIL